MTLDELETSARLHLDLYGELTMPIGTQTILDLIAKLRAAEALYDAAATFRDATLWGGAGIDSDELTRALRAYDALGGSK